MKKILITLSAIMILSIDVNAQNFLKKLKEQAAEVTAAVTDVASPGKLHVNRESAEGAPTNAEKKSAEDDYNSTDLEKLTPKKDQWGLGGIYYSTDIFYSASATGEGSRAMRKFLLEFEDKGEGVNMRISNRYSYNKPGNTMVDPFNATMDELTYACVKNYGIPQQFYVYDFQTPWNYVTNEYRKDNTTGAFPTAEKSVFSMFSSLTFYVVKPGLIICMSEPYEDRTPEETAAILKYAKPTVLYKKEFEAEAKALTKQAINKALEARNVKYKDAKAKELKKRADELAKFERENPNWKQDYEARVKSGSSSSSSSKSANSSSKSTKDITIKLHSNSKEQIFLEYKGDVRGSSFINYHTYLTCRASKPGGQIINKKQVWFMQLFLKVLMDKQ